MKTRWRGNGLAALMLGGVIVYACTTDTAIGPDAALDSLYIEPGNAMIVLDDTLRLTAIGVDSTGRRFATTRVSWSTADQAIILQPNGSAIGAVVGMASVSVTGGGRSAMAMITVQPKPIFATSVDSVPFTGIANGPDPAGQSLTITNAGGGILAPSVDSIGYGAGASGWLQAAIASGAGVDTLDLATSTTALGLGSYTATVYLGAPKATPKTITVTLAMVADAPFSIAIDSGDAQTATVNTAVSIQPTVRVRDQYTNPVSGAAVTFQVTGGGGAVLPGSTVSTDAAGRARVASWTLGTGAGVNTLQASVGAVTPVSFSATGRAGAPASTAKTAGDGQAGTVNAAVSVLPTVLVSDQFGNPVESVTVTFTVAMGGGALTGGTRKTDAAGLAPVGSWTLGTQSGLNTLSAVAAALPAETFSATGTADVADTISLDTGNNQTDTVTATLAAPYTVRVADQYGNGVQGTTVTWGASGGGSITPTSLTNGAGIASATRVLGTIAGPQGATATVASLSGSPVAFSATATHASANAIQKFAGDNQSATAATQVSNAPTARVVDAHGNAVPGVNVTFAVTAGGGSVSPTTPIATDASGLAAVTSWTLGPAAGTNNNSLRASAAGLASVTFLATGNSGAAKNLVYVSGDAQTDTISAPLSAYTVQVTDSLGNGVQGVTVSWLVTAGGGSITPSSMTDVNGFASATRVLGTVPGVDSATASVGGLVGSPRRFGATALHGNPAQIFKTAGDAQSATVNTTVTTAPQVQITDRVGNPIQSASVTFTVTGGAGTTVPASPAARTTDVNGLAQLTSWTLGTGAGANTISATSAGTPGATFSATGTAGAPSASQSLVADNAVSITACSVGCTVAASRADSVTVTVRDAFNNPVSGASVTISATGTSNTFSPSASGTSNASGVFAARLSSTVAQLKTISASATTALGGGALTPTASVTVNPTAVSTAFSTVAASASPITACQVSCTLGSTALTLTATVRDTFNNAINGAAVTLSATGTNNYFNGTLQNSVAGTSSGAGTYSASFNSGTAQSKTLSATITSGVAIAENTSATVNPGAPASVSVVNAGFSARVGTAVGTLPTYTVRDAFSNVVPSFGVSYSSSFSGFFSGPSATNAFGQVTLTSWTMSGSNADDGFGRMANTVTVTAGSASGGATDYGIYTYSGDVGPIIGVGSGCDGCHYVSWTRANIVSQPDQNPAGYGSCSGYTLVTAGNANASLIYLKTAGTTVGGSAPCGGNMPSAAGLSAATRKIIRAWINNGAPNN